jgi:L-threonylcarbamoyladenylate synthase
VLGRKVAAYRRKVQPNTAAVAPGMLERHYSPRTPLTLVRKLTRTHSRRAGATDALLFVEKPAEITGPNIFWLSTECGDLTEAAHRLFDQLRAIDDGSWSHIHAELAPGNGALALAINDRLARAAAKR